ncbi:unnamed protein product [Pedinophyceae sp. YPF-701]|nr:unnamed protein product [Pedinophyceae sp. YPF-701]
MHTLSQPVRIPSSQGLRGSFDSTGRSLARSPLDNPAARASQSSAQQLLTSDVIGTDGGSMNAASSMGGRRISGGPSSRSAGRHARLATSPHFVQQIGFDDETVAAQQRPVGSVTPVRRRYSRDSVGSVGASTSAAKPPRPALPLAKAPATIADPVPSHELLRITVVSEGEGEDGSGVLGNSAHGPADAASAPPDLAPAPARPAGGSGAAAAMAAIMALGESRHPVLATQSVRQAFQAVVSAASTTDVSSAASTGLDVACILADLGLPEHIIVAGVLAAAELPADIARDRLPASISRLAVPIAVGARKMGAVLDLAGKPLEAMSAGEVDDFRAMLLSMADVRALTVRLSLSLCELRHAAAAAAAGDPEAREAAEAMARGVDAALVPLASRLGLSSLKAQLEDLCFEVLRPSEHAWIVRELAALESAGGATDDVQGVLDELQGALGAGAGADGDGVQVVELTGRAKSLAGIHRKLVKMGAGASVSDVHDARAVRIVVGTKVDCYRALRQVERMFATVPGRTKDYIRAPKANGYRSLHTVIETPGGVPLEIQIRTRDMHLVAEYGVAAHWRYKEGLARDEAGAHVESLVGFSRYLLTWEYHLRDGGKHRPSGGSAGGAPASDGAGPCASAACGPHLECVFPHHGERCNFRDERFCGHLSDLREHAAGRSGPVMFVAVDPANPASMSICRAQPRASVADALAASNAPAALREAQALVVNGALCVDPAAATIGPGDVVEVAPEGAVVGIPHDGGFAVRQDPGAEWHPHSSTASIPVSEAAAAGLVGGVGRARREASFADLPLSFSQRSLGGFGAFCVDSPSALVDRDPLLRDRPNVRPPPTIDSSVPLGSADRGMPPRPRQCSSGGLSLSLSGGGAPPPPAVVVGSLGGDGDAQGPARTSLGSFGSRGGAVDHTNGPHSPTAGGKMEPQTVIMGFTCGAGTTDDVTEALEGLLGASVAEREPAHVDA